MTSDEKMTIDERYKYLRQMQKRYRPAKKGERQRLLDEMEQVTGLHRKSLIRLLKRPLVRQKRRQQRGRRYGVEVDDGLRVISESLDHICAERLQPNLVWLAEQLGAHRELETTPTLLAQLGQISVSTVRRRLEHMGQDQPRLPQKGPERANRLAREIPMKRIDWDEPEPGHLEVDLVHHSGPSVNGHYVHTLQAIDVTTGWSERVALLGRSYVVTQDGFVRILSRLPFPVKEIHPDNGSEFLNDHLLRFFQTQLKGVRLSRSRPYHKNDNRFVEQQNSTLVRAYLGTDRLDTVAQTNQLNHLYDLMWLYYNFFQPVLRLPEKRFVAPDQPLKRRFDPAQTPFDRLCQTGRLDPRDQAQLEALRRQTNPRQLRRQLYAALDLLFDLPNAVPDQTEDVFLTLLSCQPLADFIPKPTHTDDPGSSAQAQPDFHFQPHLDLSFRNEAVIQ